MMLGYEKREREREQTIYSTETATLTTLILTQKTIDLLQERRKEKSEYNHGYYSSKNLHFF